MIHARALVLCSFGPAPSVKLVEPFAPRATIGHYNGNAANNTCLWDTANGDVPAAFVGAAPPAATVFGPTVGNADNAKAVALNTWGPILNIGTCVSGSGFLVINLRTAVINGPTVTFPGGCLAEILSGGASLGSIGAPHNGVICNVPNQAIPAAAVGSFWCAQSTVRDLSGNAVLSSAIYGIVDVQF